VVSKGLYEVRLFADTGANKGAEKEAEKDAEKEAGTEAGKDGKDIVPDRSMLGCRGRSDGDAANTVAV
jgi:hypothetical protein